MENLYLLWTDIYVFDCGHFDESYHIFLVFSFFRLSQCRNLTVFGDNLNIDGKYPQNKQHDLENTTRYKISLSEYISHGFTTFIRWTEHRRDIKKMSLILGWHPPFILYPACLDPRPLAFESSTALKEKYVLGFKIYCNISFHDFAK